jgi:RNA polymerase sigma-70 factor, ECF subfamily
MNASGASNASKASPASVPVDRAAVPATREEQWRGYVRDVAAGNSYAFACLYDETCSLVYGIALRVLRNEADAEEVTSDVYTQIWKNAATFDAARGSVNAWLTMLARSRSIDKLRSRARARKEESLDVITNIASSEETPERSSWLGQQRARVRTALQSLSPEQREAIELAYFSGLTQVELAERLKQPLGTIKTRIRLGMIKLRQSLQSVSEAAR